MVNELFNDISYNLPKGFDIIAQDENLGPQILESLSEIEQRLSKAVTQTSRIADVTSRHLLNAGGKRIRPLLTLLAAAAGGGINDKVLDAAVVVELTHLATLYHDDVMDDAPKRRGVDTAQNIWGNSVAILTGDLIFSRASLIVSDLGSRPMSVQSQTFERLVLGQLFETLGPEPDEDILSHYIKVIEGKTGSLIAAAGSYGGILSEAPESTIQTLARYGELVGVAFQLADDVLDITGEGKKSGKTPGTDLREGVPTLPTILLEQEAERQDSSAQEILEMIRGDLSSDEALERAVQALSAHPVTARAWSIACQWADDAVQVLKSLPDSTAKEALISFAHAVVRRDS
ncbi:polyprenyl synthetase family protein [Rothia sp. P6271]|uniref:polyprenyl synthetase family protein n=1 Tax=Rothia sp. P6271 TaxID=3402659 RepID=UPI003AC2703C